MTTSVLFILIVLAATYYYIIYPYQKIKRMRRDLVLSVRGADLRYPDLPLGNLGIFISADKNHRIRVVFPKLTSSGGVEYIYSWHDVQSIRVLDSDGVGGREKTAVTVAQELAALVDDHIRFVEPEIFNLKKQWHKLSDLLDLVGTSEVYANHQGIYERALSQVEDLLDKAEELQRVYVRAIREILIGRHVADYDPNLLPDDSFAIDHRYKRVRQEYQTMKDVATAHAELLRTQQL